MSFLKRLATCCVLPLLLSCNLYKPFTKTVTDEDHVEEGQKCLHEGDFGCAISNYELITNTALRNEKLCQTYLSKAGLDLSDLLNIVTQGTTTVLGDLAQSFIPWSQEKYDSIQSA